MVLDTDARRARAVARLARWTDRAGRRLHCGHALWEHRGLGWLARNRYAAAQRHVERVAVRDVLAGHDDPDRNVAALDLDPGDDAGHHAAAVYWRAFHLATKLDHLDHLAGPAAESVRRAPRPAEMHDHDHDDRRWE